MTNIPKHQKGSQLKAIMQQKIDSGFFNKKDAREAKKALQYIEDDLFYFKNSDGTYSVRQEQQGTTTTDKDGNAVTVDPQLEVTTNAVGLHSNTGPLSLSRLGVGQGNKGSRKVANVMGYLMKSGDMTDYDSYRKAQEAKKAEEDKKNNPVKTEGTGATLTTDQDKLDNKEQDTIISDQIANIKETDIVWKTVSRDQLDTQYGLSDTSPIPEFIKSSTGSDGEVTYQIPTTSVSTGGGAKETFALNKEGGVWALGGPVAGDTTTISKPAAPTFTGGDAKAYQKYLADLLTYKKEQGEITDADIQAVGVNTTNLFNAKSGTDYTYANILNQIGSGTDQDKTDLKAGEGTGSGQQVAANIDPGPDGIEGNEDDPKIEGTKMSTKIDGQLGGATQRLEKLLDITTRPANLQKAKTNYTPQTPEQITAAKNKKEEERLAAIATGGDLTIEEQILEEIRAVRAEKAEKDKTAGIIIGNKQGGLLRKNGGVSFSIVRKKYSGGGEQTGVSYTMAGAKNLSAQIDRDINVTMKAYIAKPKDPKTLTDVLGNIKIIRSNIAEYGEYIKNLNTQATIEADKERNTVYDEASAMGQQGHDAENWVYTTDTNYNKMFQKYKGGFQDLKSKILTTLQAELGAYNDSNFTEGKKTALKLLSEIENKSQVYYDGLDNLGMTQQSDVSGKGVVLDKKGGFADTTKHIINIVPEFENKIRQAKNATEFNQVMSDLEGYIRGLNVSGAYAASTFQEGKNSKDGPKFDTGGSFGLRQLRASGYSDEQIDELLKSSYQPIIGTTGTSPTNSAGSPITDLDTTGEGANNGLGRLAVGTAGLVGLGMTIKSIRNPKGWIGAPIRFGITKAKSLFTKSKAGENLVEEGVEALKETAEEQLARKTKETLAAKNAAQTSTTTNPTSTTTIKNLTPDEQKLADLEDLVKVQERHLNDYKASGNTNLAELKQAEDYLAKYKQDVVNHQNAMGKSTTGISTTTSTLEKTPMVTEEEVKAASSVDMTPIWKNQSDKAAREMTEKRYSGNPQVQSTKINSLEDLLAARENIVKLNTTQVIGVDPMTTLKKQTSFNPVTTSNIKFNMNPISEQKAIQTAAKRGTNNFNTRQTQSRYEGGVLYNEGGSTQFTPIATNQEGIKFKASQSGKVYYDVGDGNWTEADSQEIYDYGKQIIQSQIKPQKSSQQTTQTEQTNQVEQTEQPDEIDTFLNKNQWIPFVGGPVRRKEMDAFDYLTFAGGFIPVVGAGFEAVEAARNLYDEYQANDLDWQDVARNAGEIGASFVGGKLIGAGLSGIKKANQARKAVGGMKKFNFSQFAQDGMKMEKPIINIKELGDNKIIGFKGFKLSKYKKGGKVSPKEESVLKAIKTSKYDHLNKYINKI